MSDKRDMSGVLFKNDRKEQPNHPDYEGSCTIDGKDYWMKGWIKGGAKGKFMSFAFKPKEARTDGAKPADNRHSRSSIPTEDEIPF